jgi:hypothetical protein
VTRYFSPVFIWRQPLDPGQHEAQHRAENDVDPLHIGPVFSVADRKG